jgi:predicted nuclease of predicted toxin-antitoxin system
MTLLFDHHLSRKLVGRLADHYPQASHVALHGLDAADDVVIWQFAHAHGYIIVSKDSDFNDLSTLRGAPPKLIWLRIGNSSTTRIEQVIRHHHAAIQTFLTSPTDRMLEIIDPQL